MSVCMGPSHWRQSIAHVHYSPLNFVKVGEISATGLGQLGIWEEGERLISPHSPQAYLLTRGVLERGREAGMERIWKARIASVTLSVVLMSPSYHRPPL